MYVSFVYRARYAEGVSDSKILLRAPRFFFAAPSRFLGALRWS